MAYLFDTPEQRQRMLAAIGAASVDELFQQIPESLQLGRELALPGAVSELELEQDLQRRLGEVGGGGVCFLGGGVYDHYIPAVVDELVANRVR